MIPVNATISSLFSLDDTGSVVPDLHIKNLCFDSREVQAGDAFVSMPSVAGNDQTYIQQARSQGAIAIITSEDRPVDDGDVPVLALPRLESTLGQIVHQLMGCPTDRLTAIGITGTNGKSSTSFYVSQLLSELRASCAVMGTLGYGTPEQLTETGMTTLPLERLHKVLAGLSSEFENVAIEVSSHGLDQERLAGVQFAGAVYTNLSHDHLDYHGTMEAYALAKTQLFAWPNLRFAVVNIDDQYGETMLQTARDARVPTLLTYGQTDAADLQFSIVAVSDAGLELLIRFGTQSARVAVPLYGEFNAYNAVAALGVGLSLGLPFDELVEGLNHLRSVAGRMERLSDRPLVIVDYAHTPDALQQVLKTSLQHCHGELHVVVGCGGDRDQSKRPLMGQIAAQFADKAYITSDNPRTESAQFIADQMTEHLTSQNFIVELDRAKAIRLAIEHAQPSDLVLIAGKGHEDYQEIDGIKQPFSDHAVARAVLEERS